LYSVTIGVAMQTSSRPLVLRQAHFFFLPTYGDVRRVRGNQPSTK